MTSIFLTMQARCRYRGEAETDGRRLIHFDYEVSELESRYRLSNAGRVANVPYWGSFAIDAKSLDVVSLTAIADRIPTELGIVRAENHVEFAHTLSGQEAYLLPSISQLSLTETSGRVNRNVTRLTACQLYVSNLAVKARLPALPAGLEIILQLDTVIDSHVSAVGDPVNGRVAAAVK